MAVSKDFFRIRRALLTAVKSKDSDVAHRSLQALHAFDTTEPRYTPKIEDGFWKPDKKA